MFDAPAFETAAFEVPAFEVLEPEVLEPEVLEPEVLEPEVLDAPTLDTFQAEPFHAQPFQAEFLPQGGFEPAGYHEPELSVFDPNEFEVPFEPLVGAGDSDPASTQAFAAAAWPEPEVVPPAFDPAAPEPPGATPAEPLTTSGLGQALFDGGEGDLPQRIPGASPLGVDGESSTLPTRSPGRHLSHQPSAAATPGERDARPRPERVHDLLTRHLRGIRDGRGDDFTTRVPADTADTEASP